MRPMTSPVMKAKFAPWQHQEGSDRSGASRALKNDIDHKPQVRKNCHTICTCIRRIMSQRLFTYLHWLATGAMSCFRVYTAVPLGQHACASRTKPLTRRSHLSSPRRWRCRTPKKSCGAAAITSGEMEQHLVAQSVICRNHRGYFLDCEKSRVASQITPLFF